MMMKMPQTATKQYIVQTRTLFHCSCRIKIPIAYGEQVLDDCFKVMQQVDALYNSHQSGSYFDLINKNAGQWVRTDGTTAAMLQDLKKVSQLTSGAYDVSAMPLIRLWGFYNPQNSGVPTAAEISRVLEKVDYRKIEIRGIDIRIAEGQELITGSFLKAFAVDQAVHFLKSHGVGDAVINAGGSTIYALNDQSHPNWTVNIPDPEIEGSTAELQLASECFSLSGRTNNYIKIDGRKYGHILNAATGYPSETLQVFVTTKSAFWGDVISTALFALEPEGFKETAQALKSAADFDFFIQRP